MSRPKRRQHGLPSGKKRGRELHRKESSPEIRRWIEHEAIPDKPSWMTEAVYSELAKWRLEL